MQMQTATTTTLLTVPPPLSYFESVGSGMSLAKSPMFESSKVHEKWPIVKGEMGPAQLYTTESGRLFHSGKIAIITVGLPARGKTLGVTTHAFHLGDYRRTHCAPGQDVPPDYFFVNASSSSVQLRQKILRECRQDIYEFFEKQNGQVALYDAVNPTAAGRRQLAKEFLKNDIHPIFIESTCDDMKIIEENVRNVKISSPDYAGWKPEDAVKDYLRRIDVKIPHFETMEETELDYIKMINAGERIIVNNCRFGYLPNRIVFYLMNLHIKTRRTYFARAGTATRDSYKSDSPLSDAGLDYSRRLSDTITKFRVEEHRAHVARGGSKEERPLVVWTSTRIRTVQTADQLARRGLKVRQRQQLSQLNPGAVEGMTEEQIREAYPEEFEKHNADPYHHRYPRSESYHDLAVRLEPIILELEREHNDLLIIAHESVLRVLYAYLMACSTADIPTMRFGRDEIVESLLGQNVKMTDTQGRIAPSFIAVGANRVPTASDWDPTAPAIPSPSGGQRRHAETSRSGVLTTLKGHTDKVNAVRFIEADVAPDDSVLVSGSVDGTLRLWRQRSCSDDGEPRYEQAGLGLGHEGSIVDVAVERRVSTSTKLDGDGTGGTIIASASADGTVKIWMVDLKAGEDQLRCIQSITTTPKYLPLSIALARLRASAADAWILAVAGSSSAVQIYVSDGISSGGGFKHAATLTGHENWVRSLSFVRDVPVSAVESADGDGDLLLASGSQDKYIRLWRVHRGSELPAQSAGSSAVVMGQALSNRAHRFAVAEMPYSVTFEALLLGHEDWIYSVAWRRSPDGSVTLLSSSADNSLSIWQADETSGIWVCTARLGEASGMKGSSTATGSTGGFWTGLWAPDGMQVVSFGKSGGWRRWADEGDGTWSQRPAVTGHVRAATGIAWEKDGRYLLSTSGDMFSLDQSTRLYARWKSSKHRSWFEFSRPQIHGYDINSIASLSPTKFVSGAEEKLLRVFGEPRGIAKILQGMCDITLADIDALPDVASQPVLGLSNKAVTATADPGDGNEDQSAGNDGPAEDTVSGSAYPPFEDSLSRHTLWPEEEKLYGHGYEISTLACSNRGDVVATACKASSVTHAVIRMFETKTWRQLKPALEAHSLTVNRIAFSADDKYMLSVGRDRQWTVFERSAATDDDLATPYAVHQAMPKAQTRVIFDGKWVPVQAGRVFVTAARDKTIKVWTLSPDGKEWTCTEAVKFEEPITAIDILDRTVTIEDGRYVLLALGLESGAWSVYKAAVKEGGIGSWERYLELEAWMVPDKTITQIAWRPTSGEETGKFELALSSEDSSVRIYDIAL
ncbi:hypothetical protein Dda_0847 [Drechslerella dactyloides]|uniref:Elongator complex protein 2 n=1 Tax=Drechslerella dactyloides TaxID=74499 RepID=A0AAD6NND3_DREDA|nr:hypothetical protein Dda_0847 [Drechslerella dactyloides]